MNIQRQDVIMGVIVIISILAVIISGNTGMFLIPFNVLSTAYVIVLAIHEIL